MHQISIQFQKRSWLVMLLLLLSVTVSSCKLYEGNLPELSDANTGPYLTTTDNLEKVKDLIDNKDPLYLKLLERLKKKADQHLLEEPYSVTFGNQRFRDSHSDYMGGGIHDYVSLNTYAWPNPDTKDGLPYIIRDGQTNPEYLLFDRESLGRLSRAVEDLSLAWYFTQDDAYAQKASDFIRTWFLDSRTRMNPHFQYAQFWPGVKKGGLQGIIEARDFISVIEGAGLIYSSLSWDPDEHRKLKYWFYKFLEWIQNHYQTDAYAATNVGTWLDVQKTIYALFTEQTHLLDSEAFLLPADKRITTQINVEGQQMGETSRMPGLYYSWFNLKAYVYLNEMRSRYKRRTSDSDSSASSDLRYSLFSVSGSAAGDTTPLSQAFDWLFLYATGERDWKEDGFHQINEFDTCRFIEIYRPAALSLERWDYEELVQKLLRDPKCLNINTLLTHPPLE